MKNETMPATPGPRPNAGLSLQAGHPGSDTETGPAFVAAVDPTVAVIGAGASSPYGRPDQALVTRLQERGAKVCPTAEGGRVGILVTRTGFVLATTDGPGLPVTVPGAALPPMALQFDGVFDVVNRHRRSGFRGRGPASQPDALHCGQQAVAFSDYNGNGGIDFADAAWLSSHHP